MDLSVLDKMIDIAELEIAKNVVDPDKYFISFIKNDLEETTGNSILTVYLVSIRALIHFRSHKDHYSIKDVLLTNKRSLMIFSHFIYEWTEDVLQFSQQRVYKVTKNRLTGRLGKATWEQINEFFAEQNLKIVVFSL